MVIAVDDVEQSVRTAEVVGEYFPNLSVIARARDRQHAYRLMEAGVKHVIRKTFFSGLEAGRLALEGIGYASKEANHIAEVFRDFDERRLKTQFGKHKDEAKFQAEARAWAVQLEELFDDDVAAQSDAAERDKGSA